MKASKLITMQPPKKYGKAENDLARQQAADVVDELPVMPRALVGIALGCMEELYGYAREGKIDKKYTGDMFWMYSLLDTWCDHFGASDDGWGHYEDDCAEDDSAS